MSYYHFSRNIPAFGFTGSFEEFVSLFNSGLVVYGCHWDHVLQGWNYREHENVKFVWFEDMKQNVNSVIEEMCSFVDHTLSPSQVEDLSAYLQFESMSNNKMAAPTAGLKLEDKNFMRKGQVGDWKNYLKGDMSRHNDNWIELYNIGTEEKSSKFAHCANYDGH